MKVTIYEHAAELPPLHGDNYFHSAELMMLCERTPRQKPFMAVVSGEDGRVSANLLAVERQRRSWMPPYLYRHVRILGEGCYAEGRDNMLFSMMLDALTKHLCNKVLYMEISNLSQKMFGYAPLRAAGFFPVKWMSVHNSLHSRPPEERISKRQLKRIKNAERRGVITKVVETNEEFASFSKLLHHHHWLKPRRYIPDDGFFRGMMEAGRCRIFITTFHERTIGCSVCVYSGSDAHLWYSASRRKSFATLHPNAVTYWNTIKYVYSEGKEHIRFMDVGLPYQRNPYRDFILSFGGKEVSSLRWFRISIRWINKLASWLWRE